MQDNTMITIRNWCFDRAYSSSAILPRELHPCPNAFYQGIPHLQGVLVQPVDCTWELIVRLHNQAGIPIIEGQTVIPVGSNQFIFSQLVAFGMDAYQHSSDVQRTAIAQRIWGRCAYAEISVTRHASQKETA